MGEVAGSDGEFDRLSADGCDGSGDDDGRVADWEVGLPSGEDLTPLSQALVPPAIASAFRVNPEPIRTALDVHRASQYAIANLRRVAPSAAASAALRSFSPFPPDESESAAFEADGPVDEGAAPGRILRSGPVLEEAESSASQLPDESESVAFEADGPVDEGAASGRILRSGPVLEEAESSASQPNDSCDDASERNPKRPRLAWTPQLHKRFVDVVAHLGIKNAVPKAIMQLMNVEGLTRENVASHLQKYRLYLKRMQGIPDAAASPSEHHLLASMPPATKSLRDKHMLTPLPYPLPGMIPTPIFGMAPPPSWCDGPIGMVQLPGVNRQGNGACHSYEQHHSDVAFKRG